MKLFQLYFVKLIFIFFYNLKSKINFFANACKQTYYFLFSNSAKAVSKKSTKLSAFKSYAFG